MSTRIAIAGTLVAGFSMLASLAVASPAQGEAAYTSPLAQPSSQCPPGGCTPGTTVAQSITITNNLGDQETHAFYVYRPGGLENSAYSRVPLMMVLQEAGGAVNQAAPGLVLYAATGSRMNSIADRAGFVVLYPAPLSTTWNKPITQVVVDSPKSDVPYLLTVLDRVIEQENVDPSRVYVSGASAGAQMTIELMCDPASSSRFVGYGIVSGNMQTLPSGGDPNCPATNQDYSFMNIVGTNDQALSYNGMTTPTRIFLSQPGLLDFVRRHLGCTAAGPSTRVFGTQRHLRRETWAPCTVPGRAAQMITVNGGLHAWGGVNDIDGLQAASEMWDFLSRPFGAGDPDARPPRS